MERVLVVDACDCVWWLNEDGTYSMVRINPDNSPIPFPVTVYTPHSVYTVEDDE